jgi:ATP-binding cassette subfamily B protein RaxB
MIFAFMAYRLQFTDKATNLVELLIQFRMLDLHLDRLSDIANAEKESEGGEQLRINHGRIELEQITFAYEKHLPPILNGASAVISPGECVAVTGPSGCGKTTLLKIMMGLLQPDGGDVRIDGTALRQADAHSYRRQIASAMQDDTLFSGSLAENIAFFDDDLDMERVYDAARLACIDADIGQMAMGYETPVGDMGSSLSGGQRQRLLLARALYQKPHILFLDEGTSNLDVTTEKAVNDAVSTLGITRIVVAHRPQTIAMADRVLEIRDGQLVEVEA